MSYKKIAVITGASRGIGMAVAEYLSELDYLVILIARDEDALQDVVKKIHRKNGNAVYFSVDISNSLQVKTCIQEIVNEYKQIDLLFNNAGILKIGTLNVSDEEIDELLRINLNGAIYMAKYVANQMKEQKCGYIINLSSVGGKNANSFFGIYSASKFGLSGFSEALAKEMSLYGVKVTNICPAMVATQMTRGRKFQPSEMLQLSDITTTIDYLLNLSGNAIPTEIVINCLPFVKKIAQETYKIYGFD